MPAEQLRGTTQNDILKEYIARGNFIYPPVPAMRLTTDLFAYCRERVPKWNTISISGYHMREKGCSAVQEVGFTLANAIAYVQAAIDAGPRGGRVRPAAGLLLQRPQQRLPGGGQVPRRPADVGADHARALRRARTSARRRSASTPRPAASRSPPSSRRTTSCAWRCRASRRCAAAPSRCTPTASTRRWRCPPSAPPGSRCARSRSSPTSRAPPTPWTRSPAPTSSRRSPTRSRRRAQALIDKVDELGGSVECIPFIRAEVEESAWGYEERYKQKQDIVVGVNEYVTDSVDEVEILRVDPESERQQVERLKAFKARPRPGGRATRGSRSCARRARATATCSSRCARRSRTAPASARSAA